MTHKMREPMRAMSGDWGGDQFRGTTIQMTPTLRVLLLLRPTIPHDDGQQTDWRKGGFSSNPCLWLFSILSTGALSE